MPQGRTRPTKLSPCWRGPFSIVESMRRLNRLPCESSCDCFLGCEWFLRRDKCEEKACVLSLSHLGAVTVGPGQILLPQSRCSLELYRWRGEGGVCTWLVLRVPSQYSSTQTGLSGQAKTRWSVGLNGSSRLARPGRWLSCASAGPEAHY